MMNLQNIEYQHEKSTNFKSPWVILQFGLSVSLRPLDRYSELLPDELRVLFIELLDWEQLIVVEADIFIGSRVRIMMIVAFI